MIDSLVNLSKARDAKDGEKWRLLQAEFYFWQFEKSLGWPAWTLEDLQTWMDLNPQYPRADSGNIAQWLEENSDIRNKYFPEE